MKRILLFALSTMFFTFHTFAAKPITVTLNATKGDTAFIKVFPASKKTSTGRAVVICPGGGYAHLAMEHEGYDWANFFNQMGVTTIVLKYRMPHGDRTLPIKDAEDAIKTVRQHAAEWGINPNDVGIMGSSAGGHLATTIATHSTGDAAPDFQILFYPVVTMNSGTHMGSHDNFLGKNPSKELEDEYSNALKVTSKTPRAFIVLASDDKSVPAINSGEYYLALCKNNVPVTLHSYPTGGHGFGFRPSFKYHAELLQELASWLRSW